MVQRVNFTAARVASFKCPADGAVGFMRDAKTPGLGLRVTAGGSRTYIFEARIVGAIGKRKVLRQRIGDARTMMLSEAQEKAQLLKRLTDSGIDPATQQEAERANKIAESERTLQRTAPALDAWDVYTKARTPKWSARHKADHESMARAGGEKITRGKRIGMAETKEQGILRPLLSLPLSGITRDAVAAWLEPEAIKRPTRARLAVSLLSTFLNWCIDYSETVVNSDGTPVVNSDGAVVKRYPYKEQINLDACQRIKKDLPKQKAKDDCLQREQLPLWFDHVRRIPNPTHAAYLQCLLLTGARREDMAGVRWVDVDFVWNSIVIRDKVEGQRTIPLTPYVKCLMLELKRINETPSNVRKLNKITVQDSDWLPSPWVFNSASAKNGRIQEPRIGHNKALTAAGLPPLSIHGLRRSFGTLCEWVEVPTGISAQIMGHAPSAIAEKHYRRRSLDLLRMWHTKIEDWILQEAQIKLSHDNHLQTTRKLSA